MSFTNPSNAPTHTGPAPITFICECNWSNCAALQAQLHSLIPPDQIQKHPWTKTVCMNFDNKNPSAKKTAIRNAIVHHLHIPADRSNIVFKLAPHHFPQNLLEKQPQRTTPLTMVQARALDSDNNKDNTLCQNCNLFANLLPDALVEELSNDPNKRSMLSMYVQAPVCTRKEVEDFIRSLPLQQTEC